MASVVEIFKAWGIAFNPNEEQSRVAGERLLTCNSCEIKKTNPFGVEYCGACGCPLKGKIFTATRVADHERDPDNIPHPCPDKRWKE